MTRQTSDYRPVPESTDSEYNNLHAAYHDALEIIAHRDHRISELESENSLLRKLLTTCQQTVANLSGHIQADHAFLRQTLGNGGVISAHNPNLPPDIRTMVAGEAAAVRKEIAADGGPEALYEREGFGGRRHDLELFNSIPALAAVGPCTIDSV